MRTYKSKEVSQLTAVARGEVAPDLVLRGGQLVNVYSGEIHRADVAVHQGRIAAVGEDLVFPGACREIDCRKYFISPGYVEPHSHPWVTYTPVTLSQAALLRGTTTMVMDNLMFMLQAGEESFLGIVDIMRRAPMNIFWAARPVPQSVVEGEEQTFGLDILSRLLEDEAIIASAEVTRWPALAAGDPDLLAKLEAAHQLHKRCDGHTAGCKPLPLNAVVVAGIDACHESINASEAKERLRRGLWLMLRQSSLRPDLPDILPRFVDEGISLERVMLTTDGPSPLFIQEHGFTDGLLRLALKSGLEPVKAIQLVTLHPAQFFNIDREVGGIAPGRRADILLLADLESFVPEVVFSAGQEVVSSGRLLVDFPVIPWSEMGFDVLWRSGSWLENPEIYKTELSGGTIPVLDLISCVITKRTDIEIEIREGRPVSSQAKDILYCSLLDRQGTWICNGFLKGFARSLDGLASTFNTALDLLVLGRDCGAMAQAAAEVRRMGGGIAVVQEGQVVLRLPLPLGGLANEQPLLANAGQVGDLLSLLARHGYPYHDPLYSILFLPCDFLPVIRLSREGVLDVKNNQVLLPARKIM